MPPFPYQTWIDGIIPLAGDESKMYLLACINRKCHGKYTEETVHDIGGF